MPIDREDESDATEPLRVRLWRFRRATALERCELLSSAAGFELRGTILAQIDGPPVEVRYRVLCDRAWLTREAEVEVRSAGDVRAVRLIVDGGRWSANGREVAPVAGCLDVDLAWSPSTNTLPIRRRDLAVGASSGPLTAAWIRFPDLEIEPLPQEYLRLAERRYRYTSRGGEFTAELEVDELGLVVDYGDIWERAEGD